MAGTLSDFAALDDIGFIGIAAGRRLSEEDAAFYAKKGEEARQRYHAKLKAEGRDYEEERKNWMKRFGKVATTAAPQAAYA